MQFSPRHLLLCLALLLSAAPAHSAAPADSAANDLIEFMRRRALIKPNDPAALVDLARWCHGRELFSQMADVCRDALALDPQSQPAYAMLREYDATHSMPPEPDRTAALKKEFQDRFSREFKTRDTRHFTILYDTTDQFAAARGVQLEQAYDMFYLYFDMQRLRPSFLQQRLTTIILRQYDDYSRYAGQVDGNEVPWAAGYYSGRTNRTAFYDDSTGPTAAMIEKTLAALRGQSADLDAKIADAQRRNAIAAANDLIRQRNDISAKVLNITRHSDVAIDRLNAVKTLHEATHQLAFNTGIQNRTIDYPVWLSEGIATGFESQSTDGTRGPAVVNTYRIDTLRDALHQNKLTPLKQFLSAPPDIADAAGANIFYAQSWSLFHFLYRTDRAGLEKYLSAYLAQKPGQRLSPQQHLALFTSAFGTDIDALEERWKKYLQSL